MDIQIPKNINKEDTSRFLETELFLTNILFWVGILLLLAMGFFIGFHPVLAIPALLVSSYFLTPFYFRSMWRFLKNETKVGPNSKEFLENIRTLSPFFRVKVLGISGAVRQSKPEPLFSCQITSRSFNDETTNIEGWLDHYKDPLVLEVWKNISLGKEASAQCLKMVDFFRKKYSASFDQIVVLSENKIQKIPKRVLLIPSTCSMKKRVFLTRWVYLLFIIFGMRLFYHFIASYICGFYEFHIRKHVLIYNSLEIEKAISLQGEEHNRLNQPQSSSEDDQVIDSDKTDDEEEENKDPEVNV